MNPLATTVISVVLATAAAAAVTIAMRPADQAPDAPNLARMQQGLDAMRNDQRSLQQKIDELAARPVPAAVPASLERTSASLSSEQVAAAVEAYLQKRPAKGSAAGGDKAPDEADAKFDVDGDFPLLAKSFFQDPAGWQRVYAAGKMDEVLKKFENIAAANPKDAKAQMDLANVYLSFLQLSPNKGPLAEKSDKVLDRVLELDDHHWEARFTKAISYSFYPEFTGKPKEAIAQFERLVAQQETMPPQPQEAQTYLMLGNMLERRDPAKAKEVWAKGARRHPENTELANKVK